MKIYATVSRAHIYQAIGLRDRYKEYKHSDECSGCPYRDDNDFDSCIRCRKLKVNYINDANRFGFRHRLNANSLKILLYLHFLNPDKKEEYRLLYLICVIRLAVAGHVLLTTLIDLRNMAIFLFLRILLLCST